MKHSFNLKAAERENIWFGQHKSNQLCNDFNPVLLVIYYICGKATGSLATLCCSTHCTDNSKHIFTEMKLHGLIPNFYIHVSVSHLCIPTIGPPILLYCVYGPIVGIYKLLTET
jgi:hypothetical protein